ncbi:aminotransferase class V-fold PLP-dependent enzyme [Arcticibacterium luteifluviistationis]|uniref:Phosphoserine aminotransferase n=1 Tax=Arcticibacterium luteifluviistationis TaxID=1784714 RepID=A0A2Z4GC41_9BACT|nr:aminotransferase class V-fold PLP-dependent enzyme [Arcticibacterium luteifluviistationis]AWV98862.1 phosphoserine aminotransferase [Arcticibacterium luteifluviistationis]
MNFYPGPSKIYPSVKSFMSEAFDSGILEKNHRSDSFMEMLKETIDLFKTKMAIPSDYEVYFTSSATECWEIVAQSVLSGNVQFAYNGAFGKKWFKYTVTNPNPNIDKIVETINGIRGSRFFLDQELSEIQIAENYDCFCAVQSETSNGSYINNENLRKLPSHFLKCFDVTSSLGGYAIDFSAGDVFLASVQKCLGLPSGMGVMVVSPKAIEAAIKLNERNHYNSFLFIRENFQKFQTHYTPNILNIFLLNRILKEVENIEVVSSKLKARADDFIKHIESLEGINPLIKNILTQSPNVIAIEAEEKIITMIKSKAKQNEILLGNGYGEWKNNTFRVANFPAIPNKDYHQLKAFLSDTLSNAI